MITIWDKDKFEKEEIDFYNDFHDDEGQCRRIKNGSKENK